nr:truncated vpu protein [Human immunodeficiency virus 1]
MSPLEI